MVHCRCYIGLECTGLFWCEPTQWVVGHYGHCPTHDFYNKAQWLGLNRPMKLPFWRRTFLRWLCQHFFAATSFIKKYDWQSRHWISPQCFPKFCPTNCPVGISKVSSSIPRKWAEGDANMMTNDEENDLFFLLLIAIEPQFVIDLRNVYISGTIPVLWLSVPFICVNGACNYRAEQLCLNGNTVCSFSHKLSGAWIWNEAK